jgi:hypothetical protein
VAYFTLAVAIREDEYARGDRISRYRYSAELGKKMQSPAVVSDDHVDSASSLALVDGDELAMINQRHAMLSAEGAYEADRHERVLIRYEDSDSFSCKHVPLQYIELAGPFCNRRLWPNTARSGSISPSALKTQAPQPAVIDWWEFTPERFNERVNYGKKSIKNPPPQICLAPLGVDER